VQLKYNKFNIARQLEGQMPIMLTTYSTNKIIVSETIKKKASFYFEKFWNTCVFCKIKKTKNQFKICLVYLLAT